MTPSFLTTAILKLRYAATGNKVDDFAAIQQALAQDIDAAAGQSIFWPGDLKISAAANAPAGWLACDGSAVSRAGYPSLFSAIGSVYGGGDGSSTFNLPDYRGRTIVGAGSGGTYTDLTSGAIRALTARSRGQTGGEETHTLAAAELPDHEQLISPLDNYAIDWAFGPVQAGTGATGLVNGGNENSGLSSNVIGTSTGYSGSGTPNGQAHSVMQPYGVASVLIKT